MPADIHVFHCLEDNIGVLIRDRATGACAAIDAPEEAAVVKALLPFPGQPLYQLILEAVVHHSVRSRLEQQHRHLDPLGVLPAQQPPVWRMDSFSQQ